MGIITSAIVAGAVASYAAPSSPKEATSVQSSQQLGISTVICDMASIRKSPNKCVISSGQGNVPDILLTPAQFAKRAGFDTIHRSYPGIFKEYPVLYIEVSNPSK